MLELMGKPTPPLRARHGAAAFPTVYLEGEAIVIGVGFLALRARDDVLQVSGYCYIVEGRDALVGGRTAFGILQAEFEQVFGKGSVAGHDDVEDFVHGFAQDLLALCFRHREIEHVAHVRMGRSRARATSAQILEAKAIYKGSVEQLVLDPKVGALDVAPGLVCGGISWLTVSVMVGLTVCRIRKLFQSFESGHFPRLLIDLANSLPKVRKAQAQGRETLQRSDRTEEGCPFGFYSCLSLLFIGQSRCSQKYQPADLCELRRV